MIEETFIFDRYRSAGTSFTVCELRLFLVVVLVFVAPWHEHVEATDQIGVAGEQGLDTGDCDGDANSATTATRITLTISME